MQHQLIDNAESVITQFNINDGAYVSPGRVCWSGCDEEWDGGKGVWAIFHRNCNKMEVYRAQLMVYQILHNATESTHAQTPGVRIVQT